MPKRIVQTEEVTVTPKIAREWLKRNSSNRPLNKQNVRRYAQMMTEGRWMLSTDAIGFDQFGRLVNGQHRLHAIIEAGTPQRMLVIHGLSPDAFQVIDSGARRTGSHALAVLGYKHYAMLAAAARHAVVFRRTGGLHYSMGSYPVQNDEIVQIVSDYPALIDSVHYCNRLAKNFQGWASPSTLAFLHFLYRRDYGATADVFVDKLSSGANLDQDSPILLLRNRLLGKNEVDKLLPGIRLALMVVAFNYHVHDRRVKILRWSPGGGQPFPQPDVTPLHSERSAEKAMVQK